MVRPEWLVMAAGAGDDNMKEVGRYTTTAQAAAAAEDYISAMGWDWVEPSVEWSATEGDPNSASDFVIDWSGEGYNVGVYSDGDE